MHDASVQSLAEQADAIARKPIKTGEAGAFSEVLTRRVIALDGDIGLKEEAVAGKELNHQRPRHLSKKAKKARDHDPTSCPRHCHTCRKYVAWMLLCRFCNHTWCYQCYDRNTSGSSQYERKPRKKRYWRNVILSKSVRDGSNRETAEHEGAKPEEERRG